MPTAAEARALYTDSYFLGGEGGGSADYAADEPLHRVNARDRLVVLDGAWPAPPGALLDVGCAFGYFLDEARAKGWEVAGVEVAVGPAEQARRQLGLEVHADLEDLLPTGRGRFDVVTLFQVLAHVVDPGATLTTVHELLRPGGVLIVESPDAGSRVARLLGRHWHLATPPSIVTMFDVDSLDRLLRRCGFTRRLKRRTSKTVSVGFVAGVLAHKYPRLSRPLAGVERRPALAARGVRYSLGDVMTVIAERTGEGGEPGS